MLSEVILPSLHSCPFWFQFIFASKYLKWYSFHLESYLAHFCHWVQTTQTFQVQWDRKTPGTLLYCSNTLSIPGLLFTVKFTLFTRWLLSASYLELCLGRQDVWHTTYRNNVQDKSEVEDSYNLGLQIKRTIFIGGAVLTWPRAANLKKHKNKQHYFAIPWGEGRGSHMV